MLQAFVPVIPPADRSLWKGVCELRLSVCHADEHPGTAPTGRIIRWVWSPLRPWWDKVGGKSSAAELKVLIKNPD
jgi:hypothetical protein